ncbi:MAG: DUF2812 domain-containing protein [Bacillota bacterium]|nr:DUF2812 domain-containing protein [Bacillota bacterium]
MKNTKYLLNMGLAFEEDRVIKRLNKLSKEGWFLSEMTLFRYKLIKGEAKELVYAMDYKDLKENEDEYLQIFESSGWKQMCSYGPFHFFSSLPGTVPIYTDKENYLEKYKSTKGVYLKSLIISLFLLILTSLLERLIDNNIINKILFFIGIISAAIAMPSLMVTIAFLIRKRKVCR